MAKMTPLWTPSADDIENANITKFRRFVETKRSKCFEDTSYASLWRWSVDSYSEFWADAFEFLDIVHSQGYSEVVEDKPMSEFPLWFPGARLNYAENLLRGDDNRVALICEGEGVPCRLVTYGELRQRVAVTASAMRARGVVQGDRIVMYLPNFVESVQILLAAASIGAYVSATSPDFGVQGVVERFSQINPKFIFSVNGVFYNNKCYPHIEKLKLVVEALTDLEGVIIIPHATHLPTGIESVAKSELFESFLSSGSASEPIEYAQLPFSHPLFIMYSSGTTGKPKTIVHSAGGTLLQQKKEQVLHSNLTAKSTLFYQTTIAWMMWPWLVSALSVGATALLYDGSPFAPKLDVLWDLADKHSVTVFGTSAKYLDVLEEKGVKPRTSHALHKLKAVLSTGSPLKPDSFDFVYRDIKSNVMLGSISGGTDIISCFAGSNPVCPVYRSELQQIHLGMRVQAWDVHNQPVFDAPGELVCTCAFPSAPVFFYNDHNNEKYLSAYYGKITQGEYRDNKGASGAVWAHGDFCQINSATGGITMLGRSDGTLNPAGIRFGSAEVYNVVETIAEVTDSLCVGQRLKGGDERVVLFVITKEPHTFNDALVKKIASLIRTQLSPRHVPACILETHAIPYTTNGKKVEVAIRRILSGEDVAIVANKGALANPESLNFYVTTANTTLKIEH